MTEPLFMTDEGFHKLKTIHRLRKVLRRESKGYLRALHGRCGVGLTIAEFDNIVRVLADTGWCSVTEGAQGATMVVLSQLPEVAQ
jgi:hypothetical protein